VALVVDPVVGRGGFFIGGPKGYNAHEPQGFWEVHDLQQESVVEWINIKTEIEPKSAPEPTQVARVESKTLAHKALQVRLRVPKESISPAIRVAAAGVLVMSLLVAVGFLTVLERADRMRIQALTQQIDRLREQMRQISVGSSARDDVHDKQSGEQVVAIATLSSGQSVKPVTTALSIQVNPSTPTINLAQSVQFKASVIGSKAEQKKGVYWTIDPAQQGKITKGGKYIAPAKLPSNPTVTVIATSIANSQISGKATVTLTEQKQATTTGSTPKGTSTKPNPDGDEADNKKTANSGNPVTSSQPPVKNGDSNQVGESRSETSPGKTTPTSQVSNPVTDQDTQKAAPSSESSNGTEQQANKTESAGESSKTAGQEQTKSGAGSEANSSQGKQPQQKNDSTNQVPDSDKRGPSM
jgi:hypothetical protein